MKGSEAKLLGFMEGANNRFAKLDESLKNIIKFQEDLKEKIQ